MKTARLIAFILGFGLVLFLSSCALTYGMSQRAETTQPHHRAPHLEIQRGMSMQDVRSLLGEPRYRRFDSRGEEWEYVRPRHQPNRIVVVFEQGVVINLNTFDVQIPPVQPSIPPVPERRPTPPYYPPSYGYPPQQIVDQAWFEEFFRRVEDKAFKSDRMRLIRSFPEHKYVTSQQCLRLINLFNWDNEKLEVLQIVAPRLADHQYAYKIMDAFDFSSNKDKASEILGISRTDNF